jgi:uncharacterized peroxidase-related enzyme
MTHIDLANDVPGIRSLALFRPDTGKELYRLAQVLLRDDSPLSQAERELIATLVSSKNECSFCTQSHAAAAKYLYHNDAEMVDLVLADYQNAPISDKLKSLLTIAEKVQKDARLVSDEDIANARSHGANDRDIHDTVLISATFCMFNRYVDGLATLTPTDAQTYKDMGVRMGELGYNPPTNNG